MEQLLPTVGTTIVQYLTSSPDDKHGFWLVNVSRIKTKLADKPKSKCKRTAPTSNPHPSNITSLCQCGPAKQRLCIFMKYYLSAHFSRKQSSCPDNALRVHGVRMRRAAHSSSVSEWTVCVRRGVRGGSKWSRPPRCYIRPEHHDVQTEVPDRVGGNRWRISTTAGKHHPKPFTQPTLRCFLRLRLGTDDADIQLPSRLCYFG